MARFRLPVSLDPSNADGVAFCHVSEADSSASSKYVKDSSVVGGQDPRVLPAVVLCDLTGVRMIPIKSPSNRTRST